MTFFKRPKRGEMVHKITIKTVSDASDGFGAAGTETETTLATVWAAIWPISAREFIQSDKKTLDVTHRITIDYLSGLTADDVIYFGTRKFEIISIINHEERNIYQTVLGRETI